MFKFQLPERFNGSYRRMRLRIIVDGSAIQCSPYFVNILLRIYGTFRYLTLSDHKKRVTARCSTTLKFERGAAICKEDL